MAVVICFQISIFEPLETTMVGETSKYDGLWFAFKLVSLNHWKQLWQMIETRQAVVICFQISIFEPLETTYDVRSSLYEELWFAFKLVSLNHWKQQELEEAREAVVVICFQISIFEPLETTKRDKPSYLGKLWFAFKLVSLNHWKQQLEWKILLRVSCDLLSN